MCERLTIIRKLLSMLDGNLRDIELFIIKDIKTNEIVQELSKKAQSLTCIFCKKTIHAWKAGRGPKTIRLWWDDDVTNQLMNIHLRPCGERWLNDVLCRWSTGLGTAGEAAAIIKWLEHYKQFRPATHSYEEWKATCSWFRHNLDTLPGAPGSLWAEAVETFLNGIYEVYQRSEDEFERRISVEAAYRRGYPLIEE